MVNKFKNIYGAYILIPFADWEPDSRWSFFHKDGDHQDIGVVGVTDGWEHGEDFGKFSREVYREILDEWDQFQQEYTWHEEIAKWLPNDIILTSYLKSSINKHKQ